MPLLSLLAAAVCGQEPDAERKNAILKRFADEFVVLTPGKGAFPAGFKMGSEKAEPAERPVHQVSFRQPFAIAKYEVTQELYQAITGRNPARWKGPRNSVEMIDWHEAVDFTKKVTTALRQQKLLAQDEGIRLPSEAEWEYACRAGTTTAYSFGNDVAALTEYAWFDKNSKGHDPPVGKKKPNAWGLYDMHGYVWEWCADTWHADYEGAPDDGSARTAPDAKERVLRGGAFNSSADTARCAFRHHRPVETRSDAIGFRCVRAKIQQSR
jgi:formylglycine-generating enzyme required for sulfatase activity